MPYDTSNFQNPDTQAPNSGGAYRPVGTGDHGEVWDPVLRRWVPSSQMPAVGGAGNSPDTTSLVKTNAPTQQTVLGAWGHQGDSLDANGRAIAGTNGMAQDVNRYRMMGQTNQAGPQIDRTASNESRGYGMGALGLLRQRAEGATTPAQQMQAEQTTGAVNALQSGAASVRGGAGMRAAAARRAAASGAQVQAQGDQDLAALAARERAEGANAYFGAASGQRGVDLGLATEQAKLEAGQRAANDQREGFYEGLAQDTQGANISHQLGRSEADAAAAQAALNNNVARDQAQRESANRFMSGAIGASSGLAQGAKAAYDGQQGSEAAQPRETGESGDWSDYDKEYGTTGSDKRMKQGVRPVSDKEASRLAKLGGGMLGGYRASLNAGPSVGERSVSDEPAAKLANVGSNYDGKYLGSPFPSQPDVVSGADSPPKKPTLDEAIAARVAQDNAAEPRYGYFGAPEEERRPYLGGNPGYAESRRGQAGYLFGRAPEAVHGFERSRMSAADRRDVVMSDPKAKQEAYALGRAHGFEQVTSGKPVEWAHPMPKDIVDKDESRAGENADQAPKREPTSFKRERPAAPATATLQAPPGAVKRGIDALAAHPYTTAPGSPWAGVEAVPAFQKAAVMADQGYRAAMADTPPGTARAMTSDPRAKQDAHDSPMAAANRSMEPYSYEYKAEFTPPDQAPHEKNVGPMANKMEANPVARTAIVEDPGTGLLAIDKTKALKLAMGGLGSLQRQVDRLERRRA